MSKASKKKAKRIDKKQADVCDRCKSIGPVPHCLTCAIRRAK